MKAGKKFELYFPAILFCETLRRKERKDLCFDGARKIFERSSVFALFTPGVSGLRGKRVYVGVPHFMWSWRVIEMVMKRSISVNPSGWCWIEGLCWILWQNTLPSCNTFFIIYIISSCIWSRSCLSPVLTLSFAFALKRRPGISVSFVNTVLILDGIRACPSSEICTAFFEQEDMNK